MRSVSTCLVSHKTKVNMCVWGRMPVSMVQSWRLKKEGVVPGEGEGETLTVGNAQKIVSVPDASHAPAEFRQEIRCLLSDA